MRLVGLAGMLGIAVLPLGMAYAVAPKKHVVAKKATHGIAKPPVVALSPAEAFLAANARQHGVVQTASGLQYRVIKPGTGTLKPGDDDVALVTYVGKLSTGTVFDKSVQPTPMPVNAVVPGFSESLKLMPKGATYRVWIKPSLGYGDTASGPIPAGSVLVFDIELLDFISTAQFRQMQQQGAPGAGAPN